MNPYLIDKLLEEQQRELLRERQEQQLIRQWENNHLKSKKPLIIILADMLIGAGERLKKYHCKGLRWTQA